MPAPLVLASTSRYRAELLRRLGLTFEQRGPEVDERAIEAQGMPPRALAETLAAAKADAVASELPDSIVIGSDQVCACEGRVLHKPGSEERAVEQLAGLAGRTHELITAVRVRLGERVLDHTDVARLTMRALDRDALARYVRADQPLDCAGAYKLEALGIALFERVESEDHSAITGLPLIAVRRMLGELGLQLP